MKMNTFQIIFKQYDFVEIASEQEINVNIREALTTMFNPYSMYDMNCTLENDILIIIPHDQEEFDELHRLWTNANEVEPEKMIHITIKEGSL